MRWLLVLLLGCGTVQTTPVHRYCEWTNAEIDEVKTATLHAMTEVGAPHLDVARELIPLVTVECSDQMAVAGQTKATRYIVVATHDAAGDPISARQSAIAHELQHAVLWRATGSPGFNHIGPWRPIHDEVEAYVIMRRDEQ